MAILMELNIRLTLASSRDHSGQKRNGVNDMARSVKQAKKGLAYWKETFKRAQLAKFRSQIRPSNTCVRYRLLVRRDAFC